MYNKQIMIDKLQAIQQLTTNLLTSLEADVVEMSLEEFGEYLNTTGILVVAKECKIAEGVLKAIAKGSYTRKMHTRNKEAILEVLGIKLV